MAGRPRTDVGTFGKINTAKVGPEMWEARARFRLRNGRLKPIKRRRAGKTDAAAVRALKKAMAKLADEVSGKEITPDTRFGHVMDLWLAAFTEKVTLGKRAPMSLEAYRETVENQLRPRMGELSCREAENAGLVDETLKDIRRAAAAAVGTRGKKRGKTGTAAMLRARTVASHVCGLAVRHGAMGTNPVKSIEQIEGDQNTILALEPEQRREFLTEFRAYCEAKVAATNQLAWRAGAWTSLPDVVEAELATSGRISEVLALDSDDLNLDAPAVILSHHLVRVTGVGLVRVKGRKGGQDGIEPTLPSWSLPMWRRVKLASGGGANPLFPSWSGTWDDPSNVGKRIKTVCEAIGFGWVSSRILRHTTATHIVDSGLTNEDAADALGNTPAVVQKNYRRQQRANPRVAVAMETLMGVDSSTDDV